jgi:hypothetical protein
MLVFWWLILYFFQTSLRDALFCGVAVIPSNELLGYDQMSLRDMVHLFSHGTHENSPRQSGIAVLTGITRLSGF